MPKPKYIGNTHITVSEYACRHCGKLPPGFLDEDLEIELAYQILFRAYEEIRVGRGGVPMIVNDGYRCKDSAQAGYDRWVEGGKKGAVHGFLTPHMFGMALDIDAISWDDQAKIVALARKVKPSPRIGWKQYKKSGVMIVHIDYAQFIQPSPTDDFQSGVEW
jgi:hypothetical protein